MANLFYLITLIISILIRESFQNNATVPAVGTDCLGNDFLCLDNKRFLICVENENGFQTVDQLTQTCGSQSYCDNKLSYECASSVAMTDTPEVQKVITTVATPAVNESNNTSTTETEVATTTQAQVSTTDATTTAVTGSTTTEAETTTVLVQETTIGTTLVEASTTTTTEPNTTEQVTTVTEENITTTQEAESSTGTTLAEESTTIDTEPNTTEQVTTVTEENITTTQEAESSTVSEGSTTTGEVTSDAVNETTPSAENNVVSGISTTSQITTTPNSGVTNENTSNIPNDTTPSAIETTKVGGPSTWHLGTTTTSAPTTTIPSLVCKGSGFQPHPTDCHKFIICIKIFQSYRVIDIPCRFNRAYDPKTKRCSTDTAKLCGKPKFECTTTGYFKDPYSADKYFLCLGIGYGNFRKWEFSCMPDYVFNENFNRCHRLDRDSHEYYSGESRNSNESRDHRSNESRS